MEIWTALAIGFLGSFHCIGMCGPIALALPGSSDSGFPIVAGRVLYNLGRIVTYSLLGAVFGLIGHSIALAGFQQGLSISLGLAIIAAVTIRSRHFTAFKEKIRMDALYSRIKKTISTLFNKRGMSTLFTIGVLNGLLPCGFVYVGLAGSLTTGSIFKGALYMAFFGLGTFPAMLSISLAPNLISLDKRRSINRFMPALAILLGLLLILRGFMIA